MKFRGCPRNCQPAIVSLQISTIAREPGYLPLLTSPTIERVGSMARPSQVVAFVFQFLRGSGIAVLRDSMATTAATTLLLSVFLAASMPRAVAAGLSQSLDNRHKLQAHSYYATGLGARKAAA